MENELIKTNEELLVELDKIENEIKQAEEITKRYDEIKKQIKKSMVEVGRNNNLEQVKLITPNGIKITCSIGHCAEFEKQMVKEFDLEKLKTFYPEVYEMCLEEKEKNVMVKNATNDTLRITLSKGE